jgi:hypothetical protein
MNTENHPEDMDRSDSDALTERWMDTSADQTVHVSAHLFKLKGREPAVRPDRQD